jgi:hypothetical protein
MYRLDSTLSRPGIPCHWKKLHNSRSELRPSAAILFSSRLGFTTRAALKHRIVAVITLSKNRAGDLDGLQEAWKRARTGDYGERKKTWNWKVVSDGEKGDDSGRWGDRKPQPAQTLMHR